MSSPFFQNVDPAPVPDAVTPHDSTPGRPDVLDTPGPLGTAPYDIAGPQDIEGITAAVTAAGELAGAGVIYPQSERQREALAVLESPQGAPSMNVFAGFPDYENQDLRPPGDLETPIQGQMGAYPGGSTTQDGIPMYTAQEGAGVEGVPPEGGSMDTPGGNYPGTIQGGLTKYGTS